MMKLLGLEYFKIRRKKIWVMILLFLSAEMLWAFIALSRSMATNSKFASWEAIVFSISSMNGLFMPIISAIVVSRICDMEHKGETLKMLVATNVKRRHLYAAKYICVNSLLLLSIFAQVALMIIFGFVHKLSSNFSSALFIQFVFGTFLTTLAVTALQQWLSFTIKNQVFALCLGMLGGFIGMTAGLFPAAIRRMFIWAYYLELSPIAHLYKNSLSAYIVQSINLWNVIVTIALAILFYIVGSARISRQEM
ncbi:ABC transporter permease [Bacillus cytotoxicus]|uniref:ABC transporter permease n=1 Tax=Bacillus cereus group sp. BfR-BA-01492 TaxID=2920361 RepID=UPI001F5AB1DA|nr:ABC transporter permease [Bacillus cereus group sp. BfR-BA-01492]EMA6344010.1 ABC transporter permease [Bacillus cytotoxicus]